MSKEIKKEYSNGELTIVWKPRLCIHSAVCVKMLPKVYNPSEKPWIKAENATTEELKKQIDQCPSAALSYYTSKTETEVNEENETLVNVVEGGPLIVKGALKVKGIDGNIEEKQKVTAFCRCGGSKNKPYCDGVHAKINFKD